MEMHPDEEINGRYVLKERKGRGTFGEVWLAYDRATDEEVAIKFYVALDHGGREEFIQEFRIAARLRHANLLVTKDYGEWQGHPYLTMDYCNRGSAAGLIGTLKPGPADERTIWRFIHDVAAGLAYLHAVKPDPIVHQDIKPDNVLIDNDGHFLITDFGISKRIRNTMRKQSTRALKAGAPAYMGPERFTQHPEPVLASDVWSLGASIYELAEGELPFCGQGGIMMDKGAEIPDLNHGWSESLNAVMHWCLKKDTWERARACEIAQIAEMVLHNKEGIDVNVLLARLRNQENTDTGPSPEDNRMEEAAVKETVQNGKESTQKKRRQQQRLKRLYMAGAAALLIVSGLWFVFFRGERTKIPATVQDTVAVRKDTAGKVEPQKKGSGIRAGKTDNTPVKTERSIKRSPVKVSAVSVSSAKAQTEEKPSKGTLSLGYATWRGGLKGGKPNGTGTMTFATSHRIDSRDAGRRMAESGDRVEGTYSHGHLVEGRWYKSDGSTEYILIGE